MGSPFARTRYDVVIAGARCAGAPTAMLLAREGLRVLVVDPLRYGSDTLSTHALMRGAVLQLHRWGLLDAVREAGTPPIPSVTFHYGDDTVPIPIEPRDGIDALYAPRRTVLDPLLVDAAVEAGAEVIHGQSVVGVLRDDDGRVRGARIAGADRQVKNVQAELVVGADGIRSRVARLVKAGVEYQAPHAAAAIFGYWKDLGVEGYHWYYGPRVSVGTIPTNDGETCVFVLVPPAELTDRGGTGLVEVFSEHLRRVTPEIAGHAQTGIDAHKLRAFAGVPSFLRRSTGPGWALVGDAGYYRDPITAHGITDALREAELFARAVLDGGDPTDLGAYEAARDERVRGLLDVTDRIASFEWTLEEAKNLHLALSREMSAQVEVLKELEQPVSDRGSGSGA